MDRFDRLLCLQRKLHDLATIAPKARPWSDRISFEYRCWRYGEAIRKYGAFLPISLRLPRSTRFGHELHGVFIAENVQLGDNIVIFHHVTIGRGLGTKAADAAPIVGHGVFIGANAAIIGSCVIGDGAKIGAGVTLVDAVIPPRAVIVNKSAFNLTEGRPVYS